MPSPFPGMDPYIEACGLWGDFHDKLIALQPLVDAIFARSRYEVDIDYRRALEPPLSEDEARFLKT